MPFDPDAVVGIITPVDRFLACWANRHTVFRDDNFILVLLVTSITRAYEECQEKVEVKHELVELQCWITRGFRASERSQWYEGG